MTHHKKQILIVTQAIDANDPVLGFFVRWVEEFSKHADHIEVICLKKGKYDLPENVTVHSLGKENEKRQEPHAPGSARRMGRRATYTLRFISLIWKLRHNYDTVFVHMNQEYILIAGWIWKLMGKRIYLWRNHYAGSWRTDIAAGFCTKVFCTSKHSYTAKYKKTVLLPVGIDTSRFSQNINITRTPHSILSLGRIAPSKHLEIFIDALAMLARENIDFSATIVGSPLPKDESYYDSLKEKVRKFGIESRVTFLQGVPNSETPSLYQAHEIFVNTTPSGAFDKTLFEAVACGCVVLAESKDFAELVGESTFFDSSDSLHKNLLRVLSTPNIGKIEGNISDILKKQTLHVLFTKIIKEITKL